MTLLTVSNLRKSFRSHWTFRAREALRGVSFEIEEGDLFGLIGHNGAGKTTTIKILLDLIRADSGDVLWKGSPMSDPMLRQKFGYLPELPYFYDHLTVEETLSYFGALSLPNARSEQLRARVDETLAKVHLTDRKRAKVRSLSKGLQQRLGLAQAIINEPEFLLLDEPFSGLDPIGRAEFRTILQELHSSGTTILISSHILSDVQELCNRVAILVSGEVRKTFSLAERGELFGEKRLIRVQLVRGSIFPEELLRISSSREETQTKTSHHLTFLLPDAHRSREALATVLRFEEEGIIELVDYRAEPRSLEEIFLNYTRAS